MPRSSRSVCSLASLAILLPALLALIAPGRAPSASPPPPPNVVLVVVDDLDLALGGFAAMSRVQKLLVPRATSFESFFVTTALCCPSRASFLTGQYPHNHGIYTVSQPDGAYLRVRELALESATLATALHDGGYRTALVGKYFNGYPTADDPLRVPAGWDEWLVPVENLYGQFDYVLNDDAVPRRFGHAAADYLGDRLADRADAFLREAAAGSQPFFLLFAPISPHKPATPAPRHARYYPHARAPRRGSFDEADVSDKPASIASLPRITAAEQAAFDFLYRRRLQSQVSVDEAVSRLLARLASTGALANTYVFFTSDNGFHIGQHRLRPAKATAYEEDVHVPLVVLGPGVPQGRRLPHLASGADLAPTIAELAGVELAVRADGRSLMPLLRGQAPAADAFRRLVLLQLGPHGAPPPSVAAMARAASPFDLRTFLAGEAHLSLEDSAAPPGSYRALRTRTLKYVEHGGGERELYDLASDPGELRNLAAKATPATLDRLRDLLAALGHCAGAGCRAADGGAPPALIFR